MPIGGRPSWGQSCRSCHEVFCAAIERYWDRLQAAERAARYHQLEDARALGAYQALVLSGELGALIVRSQEDGPSLPVGWHCDRIWQGWRG
jgi:hypothetical protein